MNLKSGDKNNMKLKILIIAFFICFFNIGICFAQEENAENIFYDMQNTISETINTTHLSFSENEPSRTTSEEEISSDTDIFEDSSGSHEGASDSDISPSQTDVPPTTAPPVEETPSTTDIPETSANPDASPSQTDAPLTTAPPEEEITSTTDIPEASEVQDAFPSQTDVPLENDEPDITEKEITEILDFLDIDVPLTFLPVGSSINTDEFPTITYIQTSTNDFMKCDIMWENISGIDTSVPGRIAVQGKVLPPDGYCFASGIAPEVEFPILLFDPDGTPTESAYPVYPINDTILITPGSDPNDFINYADNKLFNTEHGDYFYCKVNWKDFEAVEETGEYSIWGEYILPQGIYIQPDKPQYYTQNFFVMNDDTIYLDYAEILGGNIICKWIKEINDTENISIYYSIDNSKWNEAQNKEYGYVISNSFIIPTTALQADTDYYFKLKYENAFTKTLHIKLDKDQIKTEFMEGDRDGGDNSEQDIPELEQPSNPDSSHRPYRPSGGSSIIAPSKTAIPENSKDLPAQSDNNDITEQLPQKTIENNEIKNGIIENDSIKNSSNENNIIENDSVENNTFERITDNETVITGERLKQMTESQSGIVFFEKDGIVLEMPRDFIANNNIQSDDTISVKLDNDTAKINIAVNINNNPVTDISGSSLHIPEEKAVLKKAETEIPADNRKYKDATFTIDETGEYDIENMPAEKKNELNSLFYRYILFGIVIAGLLFIILLIRKKVNGHRR